MLFANRELLYRSSIFKLLIFFASILFLMMGLLMYQLYSTSVQLYNNNLDDWLREETIKLTLLAKTEGKQALKDNIKALDKDHRYIYQLNNRSSLATLSSTSMYPVIAQVENNKQSASRMRATTIRLEDGSELVVGISLDRYNLFQNKLNMALLWGTFYPFLGLFVLSCWIAIYLLKRLNLVNQVMNKVISGERGVRLAVGPRMDEFDLLAVHFNCMLEQMEKSENSLKSLTVDIAHDLRTPMGRIKLRIEALLYSGRFLQENEKALESIQHDFALLLDTFSGMMELYHLETGRIPIAKQNCNLSKIVQDALDFVEPLAAAKNQKIYLTIEMPCFLQANPSLIFRAVFNILDNAIKYTQNEGVIEIIVDCFGVVAADNGKGIDPQDRERVLDQLVRLDPSRSVHGFGLGLALVNTVMKIHNGKISLSDNRPGLRARLLFNDLVGND